MNQEKSKLDKHGFRMIIREYISRVLVLLLLLISSGDFRWQPAWVFFWLMMGMNFIFHLVVVIPDPELYNERGKIQPNVEFWDKKLLFAYALIGYLSMVFMGLDYRFSWTTINENWIVPGAAMIILSFALSAWAMRVNRFFSSVVRIQDDRRQQVCDRGPYSVIRHPGYFSAFLFYLGALMMLGSLVGLIFVVMVIGLFSYRIIREEEALTEKLSGYKEYKERVRYRLLPGIW